jgi:hypothetical protein
MYYDYFFEYFQRFLKDVGKMAWNLGPFIIHTPVGLDAGQTQVTISAEMWSDTLQQTTSPAINQRIIRYRLLPSSTWLQTNMTAAGTDYFTANLTLPGGTTGLEYYLAATDHRNRTQTCPIDAPTTTFLTMFPSAPPPLRQPSRVQMEFTTSAVGTAPLIEWSSPAGVKYFEIRLLDNAPSHPEQAELIATVSPESPRYLFAGERWHDLDPARIRVFAVLESAHKP